MERNALQVTIFLDDPEHCAAPLSAALAALGVDSPPAIQHPSEALQNSAGQHIWLSKEPPPDSIFPHIMMVPVRIGMLADSLRRLNASETGDDRIIFGPYELHIPTFQLKTKDGAVQKLTEMETRILKALHDNAGGLSRTVLLREVWGYADNVETHTLETHIYRLRRKIENDPAAPVFLVTIEDGYRLL